jgi:formylglycine-generating enzyme required for sulfatase activity
VVTNVVAAQIAQTGQVAVTYNVSDADNDQLIARVFFSSDNGVTFGLVPVSLSGDVNKLMSPGTGKQIIWDAGADYPGQYWAQVVAKVVVSDGPASAGEMVLVPAGGFIRGSTSGLADEQPQKTITLDAFYIDKFQVTNAEFEQFINAGELGGYFAPEFWSAEGWAARQSGGWTQPAFWGAPDYRSGPGYPGFPVIGVSWYEAEAYANYVGKRLPTEAEWEKAARGTDGRTYPWGNMDPDPSRANYDGSGDPFESGSAEITPVGLYDGRLFPSPPFQTTNSPSLYGAYDMAGNVWEWVHDWYAADYYSSCPLSNPPGPATGTTRVSRGGSWGYGTAILRCAGRGIGGPAGRYDGGGFRCARTGP